MKFAKMTAEQKATYEATKAKIQAEIRLENAKYDREQADAKKRKQHATESLEFTKKHNYGVRNMMEADTWIAPTMKYKKQNPLMMMLLALIAVVVR